MNRGDLIERRHGARPVRMKAKTSQTRQQDKVSGGIGDDDERALIVVKSPERR